MTPAAVDAVICQLPQDRKLRPATAAAGGYMAVTASNTAVPSPELLWHALPSDRVCGGESIARVVGLLQRQLRALQNGRDPGGPQFYNGRQVASTADGQSIQNCGGVAYNRAWITQTAGVGRSAPRRRGSSATPRPSPPRRGQVRNGLPVGKALTAALRLADLVCLPEAGFARRVLHRNELTVTESPPGRRARRGVHHPQVAAVIATEPPDDLDTASTVETSALSLRLLDLLARLEEVAACKQRRCGRCRRRRGSAVCIIAASGQGEQHGSSSGSWEHADHGGTIQKSAEAC
jgi:hypothetical protein